MEKRKYKKKRVKKFWADKLEVLSKEDINQSKIDSKKFWQKIYEAAVGKMEIAPKEFWNLTIWEFQRIKDARFGEIDKGPSKDEVNDLLTWYNKNKKFYSPKSEMERKNGH